jgi:transposase
MSGVIKVEILETVDELRELLKSTENQEVKDRIQALYWLKSGQVKTTRAIANLIGKHRVTVSRWLSNYKTEGIKALLVKGKSSGRKKKLNPSLEESLKQELEDPEGFSSYKEVQTWLLAVHDRLGAKLKVPRPTHSKQKPGAVESFKKNWERTSNKF